MDRRFQKPATNSGAPSASYLRYQAWAHALLLVLAAATIIASLYVAYIAGTANGGLLDRLTADQHLGPLKLETVLGPGVALLMSCVKTLLPVTTIGTWQHMPKVQTSLVWLGVVGYCWVAAMVPLLNMFTGSPLPFFLLAAGWLLVELLSGILPVIVFVTAPAGRSCAGEASQPRKHDGFGGNVASLLDHLRVKGLDGFPGLQAVGQRTIICSQSAIADHAGCSKTDAHRQLRRLEREGRISLMTNRRETRIEFPSPRARARRTPAPLLLLGTPAGTEGTWSVPP